MSSIGVVQAGAILWLDADVAIVCEAESMGVNHEAVGRVAGNLPLWLGQDCLSSGATFLGDRPFVQLVESQPLSRCTIIGEGVLMKQRNTRW
jgi:hypothetical protein